MKNNNRINPRIKLATAIGPLASALLLSLCCDGSAQTAEASLPPAAKDVVKLVHEQFGDDVILTYIRTKHATCELSAEDLILLRKEGVSQPVLKALQQTQDGAKNSTPTAENTNAGPRPVSAGSKEPASSPTWAAEPPPIQEAASTPTPATPPPAAPAPSAAPTVQAQAPARQAESAGPVAMAPAPAAPPPAAEATFDSFHEHLSPYGQWINLDGTWLWQPTVCAGWRPYFDCGHWVDTDAGWYWQSDYPWGDIVFHYGRWSYHPVYGWLWAPAYVYAPAWVVWRQGDVHLGWAPLPFGAVLTGSVWFFNGVRVEASFEFGLGPACFSFVTCEHFWEHDYRHYVIPHDRAVAIYRNTTVINHYTVVNKTVINHGPERYHVATLTHHEVRTTSFQTLRTQEHQAHVEQRQKDITACRAGRKIDANRPMPSPSGSHDSNHSAMQTAAPATPGLTHSPTPKADTAGTVNPAHLPDKQRAAKAGSSTQPSPTPEQAKLSTLAQKPWGGVNGNSPSPQATKPGGSSSQTPSNPGQSRLPTAVQRPGSARGPRIAANSMLRQSAPRRSSSPIGRRRTSATALRAA